MHSSAQKHKLGIRDITIFAVLGTLMYMSYAIMQGLPNIHLLAVLIGTVTLTYRIRALIPIYVYVLLSGIFSGFSFWWVPYLYIWLPLWLAFLLAARLVKKFCISRKIQIPLYMVICGLHGLLYGIMYAPMQALFFGLSFEGLLAWIIAGFFFDVVHAVSNFFLAALIVPLTELLAKISGSGQQAGHIKENCGT